MIIFYMVILPALIGAGLVLGDNIDISDSEIANKFFTDVHSEEDE